MQQLLQLCSSSSSSSLRHVVLSRCFIIVLIAVTSGPAEQERSSPESRPPESRPAESRPPESRPPESRPPESRPAGCGLDRWRTEQDRFSHQLLNYSDQDFLWEKPLRLGCSGSRSTDRSLQRSGGQTLGGFRGVVSLFLLRPSEPPSPETGAADWSMNRSSCNTTDHHTDHERTQRPATD